MSKPIVAVTGGTGAQGGGVVDALLTAGDFSVRVLTRNPGGDAGKALAAKGVEVVAGDMLDSKAFGKAVEGVAGLFLVTNFWDPAQMPRETEVGVAAVKTARAAGVGHLIWSTLPNSEKLTGGSNKVVHFTGKALIDDAVEQAGFERYNFVHAPMYFQNFLSMMAPQPLPSGARGWAVPMDPAARVIHAGDVRDVGKLVAAAFRAGADVKPGAHFAVCGGVYSWNDFVATLRGLGHSVDVARVPAEVYDGFYPGAHEMRDMFEYWEKCTYFGPDAESRIAAARALVPDGFLGFEAWAREHFPPS